MINITFTAFNFGTSGNFVNGPGTSIYNLCRVLKECGQDINIDIFSQLKPGSFDKKLFNIRPIDDKQSLANSINNCDILHHWSGIGRRYGDCIKTSNQLDKVVFIGPNVIDCVNMQSETSFLKDLSFNEVFTINNRLKYLISKKHSIALSKVSLLMVGPDQKVWSPTDNKKHDVLWKGNASHFVKDVGFGIEVSKRLPEYNFKFIGYPNPYRYKEHIEDARSSKLYICTSLSETMGIALMEQWSAGVPSVTHPKIYLHGKNYKTGIITNRDIDSYCDAIKEIFSNKPLYNELSNGCVSYMKNNFSDENIYNNYMNIIGKYHVG